MKLIRLNVYAKWYILITIFLILISAEALAQSVSPSAISTTLKPGESHTEDITVNTGSTPVPSIDVVFTIDLTGSMGDEIAVVKVKAVEIMNGIRSQISDSHFGLATFMDYPGYYS